MPCFIYFPDDLKNKPETEENRLKREVNDLTKNLCLVMSFLSDKYPEIYTHLLQETIMTDVKYWNEEHKKIDDIHCGQKKRYKDHYDFIEKHRFR